MLQDILLRSLPGKEVSYQELNQLAIKRGYVVHPDCCTKQVQEWLHNQPVDYNATFYQEWEDITSRTRAEIAVDQVISYIFNYIFDYQLVPNTGSLQPSWKKLKTITPISQEELNERLGSMLYSGIALEEKTILVILDNITEVDINKVKNKEALVLLVDYLGEYPNDSVEFLRYLIYKSTDQLLLIKSPEVIQAIKQSTFNPEKHLHAFGLVELAKIFNRFKPIFLAFKSSCPRTINKISKLSKKYHEPMQESFWNTVLQSNKVEELQRRVSEINNFTKIKLIHSILEREKGFSHRFFGIRNGKLWVKQESIPDQKRYHKDMYAILYNSLVESLSKKATTFTLPKYLDIKLPSSEKSFVGNYPIDTSISFEGKNVVVGIHRLAKDAHGYLDFSLNSKTSKIGWNSNFSSKANSIIFSGDICDATRTKECVELFFAKNGFNDNWLAKVNNYDGHRKNDEIPFKFFIAIEEINKIKKNYMVDPNNIIFQCQMNTKKGKAESTVGCLVNNKFILGEYRTSNKSVSGQSITDLYADYALKMSDAKLSLRTVLIDAGFTASDDAELDFSSKDQIINLLS